ncbi:hypothetical protein MNV49_006952 [Pseudohyphozyma bogoriensis]|nr:hypothetical protein MNV49_006952 [Pseudohyphozyma bogoriensis]
MSEYVQEAEQFANSTEGKAIIAGVEGEMGMNSSEAGFISAADSAAQGGGFVQEAESFVESSAGEALVKEFI